MNSFQLKELFFCPKKALFGIESTDSVKSFCLKKKIMFLFEKEVLLTSIGFYLLHERTIFKHNNVAAATTAAGPHFYLEIRMREIYIYTYLICYQKDCFNRCEEYIYSKQTKKRFKKDVKKKLSKTFLHVHYPNLLRGMINIRGYGNRIQKATTNS